MVQAQYLLLLKKSPFSVTHQEADTGTLRASLGAEMEQLNLFKVQGRLSDLSEALQVCIMVCVLCTDVLY